MVQVRLKVIKSSNVFISKIYVRELRISSMKLQSHSNLMSSLVDIDLFIINCIFLKKLSHLTSLLLSFCSQIICEQNHLAMLQFGVQMLTDDKLGWISHGLHLHGGEEPGRLIEENFWKRSSLRDSEGSLK